MIVSQNYDAIYTIINLKSNFFNKRAEG